MFAKKTIKRAESLNFHTRRNFEDAACVTNFYIVPSCSDPDFNYIVEHNNAQHEYVAYLGDNYTDAYNELCRVQRLPWYKKLFLA